MPTPEEMLREIHDQNQHSMAFMQQDTLRIKVKKPSLGFSKENSEGHSNGSRAIGSQSARDYQLNSQRRKTKPARFVSNEGLSNPAALAAMNNYFLTTTNSLNSYRSLYDRISTDERLQSAATVDHRNLKSERSASRKSDTKAQIQQKRSPGESLGDKRQHKQGETRKIGLGSNANNTLSSYSNSVLASPSKRFELKLNMNKLKEAQKASKIGSMMHRDETENDGFFSSRSGKDNGRSKETYDVHTKRSSMGRKITKGTHTVSGSSRSPELNGRFKEQDVLEKPLHSVKINHHTDLQPQMKVRFEPQHQWLSNLENGS